MANLTQLMDTFPKVSSPHIATAQHSHDGLRSQSTHVLAQAALTHYNVRKFDEAQRLFEVGARCGSHAEARALPVQDIRAADPLRLDQMDTYSNILYVKVRIGAPAWLGVLRPDQRAAAQDLKGDLSFLAHVAAGIDKVPTAGIAGPAHRMLATVPAGDVLHHRQLLFISGRAREGASRKATATHAARAAPTRSAGHCTLQARAAAEPELPLCLDADGMCQS